MIDTVFFLLVFFMIASLSMSVHRALPVSLPQAASGRLATPHSADITVTREGTVLVDRQTVDVGSLPGLLQARKAAAPELALVIHADQDVTHGRVVAVLDAARVAGIGRIAIAIMPKAPPGAP
jgi:biopolymer transport protein ExbD